MQRCQTCLTSYDSLSPEKLVECLETKAQTHTKSEIPHKITAAATIQENCMQNI